MGIDEHVKLLGGLLILLGIAGFFLAIAALIIVGSPFSLIMEASQAGTMQSLQLPLIQIFGAILILIGLLGAVPCVITGLALRKFRPWAREATMVVCTILLAAFPIGTALGIYGFWVVLSPEVEPLFSERSF